MSSPARLLVLGVVRILQPVHGYDVLRELLSWRADQWLSVAPGSVYNQLKTLTRAGMLEVVGTEQQGNRPARTTYRVTRDGDNEFYALLRAALWRVDDASWEPLYVALCFAPFLTREELDAALEHRAAQLDALRRSTDFDLKGLDRGTAPPHVAEVYHLNRARFAAEAAWSRAFAERLRGGAYYAAGEDAPPDPWTEDPRLHPGTEPTGGGAT